MSEQKDKREKNTKEEREREEERGTKGIKINKYFEKMCIYIPGCRRLRLCCILSVCAKIPT